MTGTLTFNAGEVRKLLEHTASCTEHKPTMSDAINPLMHKDGVLRDSGGNEIHLDSSGWPLAGAWPDSKNIDQSKIPPGLWLVGDHGIYLMSNGSPGLLLSGAGDDEHHHIVYPRECNPDTMDFDDWYDAKNRIFGHDDGVEFLPLSMFKDFDKLDSNARIRIYMDENSLRVEFIIPPPRPKARP